MKNSFRSILIAVANLGLVTLNAVAQPLPYATPTNVIQLSSSGSVDVQQDVLSISLSTTREATEASAVQTQLKLALDAALLEAKKVAQQGKMDVRTGHFSLSPRYGNNGKINGWQGSAELVLDGNDFERIAATAGKIQTLSVANVQFSLSREQRILAEAKAQNMAIERFKAKASDIASGFGFTSYTLREVAVTPADQGYAPRPRVMAMELKMARADATVPIESGKNTVIVTVSGTVQLR